MSTLRVENILNKSSRNHITLNSSGIPTIANLEPNIIFRDGDSSTLALLELSSFNEIHVYTSITNNNTIWMRTSLVQNAIYEIWNNCASGGANIDARLFPNGTSYTGEFVSSYRANVLADSTFIRAIQTQPQFYFDHLSGVAGTRPTQHWVFSTGPSNKYMQFEGADNAPGFAIGYSRWTNDTRTWDWVGSITTTDPALPYKRCWIRRIG
jgi:hypothetical protein